jgi:hypothetical protein
MDPVPTSVIDRGLPDDKSLAAVPAGEARERLLSQLVSAVYRESPLPLRARLLECLLRPLRPLGLVAVAAGAFGSFLHRESWGRLTVSLDDAVRFSADQVFELAHYVDQVRPEAFAQVAALLTENPVCLTTLSGSLLLLALRTWLPDGTPALAD